jgi:hypothetical protein
MQFCFFSHQFINCFLCTFHQERNNLPDKRAHIEVPRENPGIRVHLLGVI